jgi:hypothetical protein
VSDQREGFSPPSLSGEKNISIRLAHLKPDEIRLLSEKEAGPVPVRHLMHKNRKNSNGNNPKEFFFISNRMLHP